jgi:hypothetical protein
MAFMELLADDSPCVGLAVGSGGTITLDAMPIQFTAPVTARQTNRLGEDSEEPDATTLGKEGCPHSPQLGNSDRSLGVALADLGITGGKSQRRAVDELTLRHGVAARPR